MADQITREEFADHMDAFEQRLGARASRTDRRLETIDSQLDAIDGRLDTIDTRLDVIDGRLRGLNDRLSSPGADAEAMPSTLAADRVDTSIERPLPGPEVLVAPPDAIPQGRGNEGSAVDAAVSAAAETAPIRHANRVKPARGRASEPPRRARQRRRI